MDEDDDNPFKDIGELNDDGMDMQAIEADLAARYGMSVTQSIYQADTAGASKLLDLSDSDDSEDQGYKKMKTQQ